MNDGCRAVSALETAGLRQSRIKESVARLRDSDVDVPDLAGWRRERMPLLPQGHRYTVVPDWVCEVLSSSTESVDREIKMPIYAQFGVAYAWLLDPRARTLEAYALDAGNWREIGRFRDADIVWVAPFDAVPLDLDALWGPTGVGTAGWRSLELR
jgi:Uma2 family endonuclease